MFEPPAPPARAKPPSGGHLAEPLTRAERRQFGRFYAENIKLVQKFAGKLRRKHGRCVASEDINSCTDLAFLKACRAWDPERGAFSTIFWRFAEGEVLHHIRSGNWGIAAPYRTREMGMRARRMLETGMAPAVVCQELHCSADDLRLALVATAAVGRESLGFELHACPRPTPWDALEDAEN